MTNQNLNSNSARINNLKSLAGSIAHETRNPLAAIKSACELVKENLDSAMELLDLISISSSRGLLISEIILQNIANEEIDKSKFMHISMGTIIEGAMREYAFESAEQKKLVNVDLSDDFDYFGDETLMVFVVFNLLKNSLYYKAKVNIWLDGDNRCLYFKDDGVGIAADKIDSIFDDFMTSGKKGGTGLGLPFCKRVMNSFGGDIYVKSEVGKGTEFCLKF
ncbi:MAG: two-component system CAI-1 autoinducer sensor kinase/phosphatase CqsS [Rickettsiales bacterium]|jgi:two-component system CAI-1 autoinducer sensor kinase/phosphatase CqsS